VGKTPSFIKDSSDFIQKTQHLHLDENYIMAIFYVISLFTKILVPEALNLISNLVSPKTLNLIEIFLTSTFFTFKGIFYEKTKGTSMGSSLSSVVVNIFMEHFEGFALNRFDLKPKCWFSFVDDTFVVWPHGQPSLISFFNHRNSISPHIQFMMEIQKENYFPLLDVLVSRQSNGTLTHQFYRKNTLTDRYIHAQSHHHPAQKYVSLKTLVTLAY
jgi:hypothetical protein